MEHRVLFSTPFQQRARRHRGQQFFEQACVFVPTGFGVELGEGDDTFDLRNFLQVETNSYDLLVGITQQ